MPRMGPLAKGRQKFSNFHCAIPEGAVKTKVSTLRTHTTASSSCPTNQGGPICHHGKGLKKAKKRTPQSQPNQKLSTTKCAKGPQWYTLPPVNPQTRSSKESSERERKGDLAKIIGGARRH